MTSNIPQPVRRRRGRSILIVGAAVVLGLVVGLLVVGVSRHKGTAGQPVATAPVVIPASSPVSSAPVVIASVPRSADNVSGTLADGCLGGPDSFSAVLAAQKAATADNNGAAAFTRTVARWAAAYPSDPNAAAVLAKIQAPGSAFAEAGLIQTQKADAALQSQGYVSGRVLPNLGQYRVLAGTTGGADDSAIIQIQIYRELTNTSGQTSQTALTTELVLQLSAGVWTVVGSPPNQQDPPASAVPWQSFARAC